MTHYKIGMTYTEMLQSKCGLLDFQMGQKWLWKKNPDFEHNVITNECSIFLGSKANHVRPNLGQI